MSGCIENFMSVHGLEIFLVSVYPHYVSSETDFIDWKIRVEIWLAVEAGGFFLPQSSHFIFLSHF